jgi:uncharacterized membrane protein YGL010W
MARTEKLYSARMRRETAAGERRVGGTGEHRSLGRPKKIDALLADYAEAHRTPGNVVCHTAGISLIVFGVLSMLSAVPMTGRLTAAEVLLAVSLLAYLALDPALGAATVAAAVLLDLLARLVSDWRVGAAAFAIGWIFQGIGHAVYEKNRPAFLRNLAHLLVGPAYLVNKLVRIRPVVGPAPGAAR